MASADSVTGPAVDGPRRAPRPRWTRVADVGLLVCLVNLAVFLCISDSFRRFCGEWARWIHRW